MSKPEVRNSYGETLTQCEERFLRERVTPIVGARYARALVIQYEMLKDSHHAAFYAAIARLLEARHG